MKDLYPRLKKKITEMNMGYQIKISARKNQDDTYSLRLDYYSNGKRHRSVLGLRIVGDSKNKLSDENNLNLAKMIRNKKELELIEKGHDIIIARKERKICFIEYYDQVIEGKADKNYRLSLENLRDFVGKQNLYVSDIDRHFCLKFKDYLQNLSIKKHTAHHYLTAFKYVINQAVQQGHISVNPVKGISIKYEEPKIEFLTVNEVQELINHPCKYPQIKNSYIFSCFTGLRKSDINQIKFSDIRNNYLYFRQEKTGDVVRIKLSRTAIQILEEQRKVMKGEGVFSIPTGGRLSERLKEWVSGTSIEKDITYHTSRHTFGTLLITKGEDIYTVMKLMGHRNISTTLKYLHLVDSKKDKAIDSLDELFDIETPEIINQHNNTGVVYER